MKSGNLFDDFVWRRATGGYNWKEVLGGLLLVPADGKNAPEETYRLGDKASTGLFMQFAKLEQTPDSFRAFANQFGMLGHPVTVDYFEISKTEIGIRSSQRIPLGERPSDAAVCGYSFWKGDPPTKYAKPLRLPTIRGEFYSSDDGDQDGGSWLHHVRLIRWLIEARQKTTTRSALRNDAETAMRDAVALTLDDQLAGRLAPVSLIGALWLQAALAGGKEYRNCPMCSTPIEISRTGGARADAVFCSDKCKSKDYRQRRATARSLHEAGVALRKIAKQINTDIKTVKNWLK